MIRRLAADLGFLACCALASTLFAAQTLFKSTMPDGSVIFADKPVPGAAKVESLKPDTADKGIRYLSPGEAAQAKKAELARAKGGAADDRVRAAEKALSDAEAALAKGEEPLPGERTGNVGGGSRLNDEYFKRQQKLKDDVESARRALEQARTQSK